MEIMDKDTLKEYMLKEIDIIQETIERMNFNSFLIKGWTITLVSVALLINGDDIHVCIAFIPLISFWFLDSYFLWQERMYRKLYDWVVYNRMKTDEHLFNMNAYRFKGDVDSKQKIMFSTTLAWFYLTILMLIIIYLFLLHCYL